MAYLANAISQGKFPGSDYKIYALTKQAENFDSLKADDILGLAEISLTGKNKIHVNYLQVDPEQVYKIEPDYNKIGSRILDSLKNLYKIITLKPNSKGTAKFTNEMVSCRLKKILRFIFGQEINFYSIFFAIKIFLCDTYIRRAGNENTLNC